MKKLILFVLFGMVAGGLWWFTMHHHMHSNGSNTTADGFDTSQYSLGDAASLWVVVNKTRPLNPKNYAPSNLVVPNIPLRDTITDTEKYVRADTAQALQKMVNDAATQNIHLDLQSGYRSYQFQTDLYQSYVAEQGATVAESQSAQPGYSEHQTGLAADLGGTSHPSCDVQACFANTVEGQWIAANAYKYGFIIRYPADKVAITGFISEPWHVRYIGTALSEELHKSNTETLEEFFGLPAAPDYK